MIITCPFCEKKFEIDASLIPNIGRKLQCGSCGKKWFYNPNTEIPLDNSPKILSDEKIITSIHKLEIDDTKIKQKTDKISSNESLPKIQKYKKNTKINPSNKLNLGKILSYFLVLIITFISLSLWIINSAYKCNGCKYI